MALQNRKRLLESLQRVPPPGANPAAAKTFVDQLAAELGASTIAHTTNLLKGDGAGSALDSGIDPTKVVQADNTYARPATINQVVTLLRHYGLCAAFMFTFLPSLFGTTYFGDIPASADVSTLWVAPSLTLTINGITFDLTANRTWTVVTPVSGVIGFTTDGAGLTILTGTKGYFTVDYSGTITGWSLTADGSSPTCTIDVWKLGTGTALPTVTNTITASAKPQLTTGNAKRSSTLTGWTTAFTAGDIFGFHVDAVTAATKITFALETTR